MASVAIVVLSDGETWSPLDGTCICFIDEAEHDDLQHGRVRVQDLKPSFEMGMTDYSNNNMGLTDYSNEETT